MRQAIEVSEQRKRQRKESSIPLKIYDRDTTCQIGTLVNITVDGILMASAMLTEANREFRLCMELPEMPGDKERVEFTARSVWSDADMTPDNPKQFWTGFSIVTISESDMATIQTLIDEHL